MRNYFCLFFYITLLNEYKKKKIILEKKFFFHLLSVPRSFIVVSMEYNYRTDKTLDNT